MPESEHPTSSKDRLNQASHRLRKLFLLSLTLEMIRHSKVEEFFVLQKIIKRKNRDVEKGRRLEKRQKREREYSLSIMHKEPVRREIPGNQKMISQQVLSPPTPRIMAPKQAVRIPEYPLPPTVQNIKPIPTNIQIELGKLNPLIQDQNVRSIECNGPEENIIVRGNIGTKTTRIILSKEDIDQIINAFSESARIPISEGVFKIVVGRLILSAIISEVVGCKFIIRKMTPQSPSLPQERMPYSNYPPQRGW